MRREEFYAPFSLSFIDSLDKTDSMRIILHLIALLSFIAIPLAESQTIDAAKEIFECASVAIGE